MHVPVLTNEVLEYLSPNPNENFIDGTVGQGGHALTILQKTSPDGKLLGIDKDATQIENAKSEMKYFGHRVVLVHDSYVNVKNIVERVQFGPVSGMLLDLGYSSWHLEDSKKGFSFNKDEALDMRYDSEILNPKSQILNELTAKKIVNEYSESDLKRILEEFGEESFAKRIAKEIITQRKIKKIETTLQLVAVLERAIPRKFHHGKIHCATRTFQALRIAVNDELGSLAKALPLVLSILEPGGRLVIIAFHSLEDRIIKNFFKERAEEGIVKILTKKPIMASDAEVLVNPRARSAKLRAVIKL